MADITLRLVWYRLGETYKNMGERYERFLEWYEGFSWRRVDILDMLFLGWLLAAFLVVGAINLYLRFFGLPRSRKPALHNGTAGSAGHLLRTSSGNESCQWINATLNWIYLHYNSTPEFVDAWLRALNEQARKQTQGDVQIKFERIQPGSLPPRVTQICTESTDKDTFTVRATIEASDITLLASAMQNTATSLKVTNCDVIVQRLQGQVKCELKVQSQYNSETIDVNISFVAPPELKLSVRSTSYDRSVDTKMVETVVRNAVASAHTSLSLSSRGGYPSFQSQPDSMALSGRTMQQKPDYTTAQSTTAPVPRDYPSVRPSVTTAAAATSPAPAVMITGPTVVKAERKYLFSYPAVPGGAGPAGIEDHVPMDQSARKKETPPKQQGAVSKHPVVPKQVEAQKQSIGMLSSMPKVGSYRSRPLQPNKLENQAAFGRSSYERRLLVKVIKANGLGDRDFGCTDPYCIVQLDEPAQKHTTSVVKNTVNPFWDEHFLFEVFDYSRHLKFEVFDREKPVGDDFLGRATISVEEVRRMPSSRQIIPLTGKPGMVTHTSGSITIEFLFMDPGEAQAAGTMGTVAAQPLSESSSPRRRIETSRVLMPGGTVVTTTVNTTQRPRADQRGDPHYNESPNRIEKTDLSSGYAPDYSPFSSRASSHLGAHDAALTASQAGGRPLSTSPKLTITKPDQRGMTLPVGQTIPTDHLQHQHDVGRDNYSLSTTASSEQRGEMKKKSTFATAFKKRFSRPKKATRSQSADRAQSASFRESTLLKPPEHVDTGVHAKTAEDLDSSMYPDGSLRKSRSHSFSSSLRRLFKKKKNPDGTSREGSVSRSGKGSREGSIIHDQRHPSPQLSYRDGSTGGQLTLGPAEYTSNDSYSYSTSVPVAPSVLSENYR